MAEAGDALTQPIWRTGVEPTWTIARGDTPKLDAKFCFIFSLPQTLKTAHADEALCQFAGRGIATIQIRLFGEVT